MTKVIKLGPDTPLDLPRLIDTRLLIQANSGGGKSYAIRRLLEQTHGHVQQLVIDLEGEFATLRERYDYVLAAPKGGEAVATPRAARLLAERLLELGVSAILDIYELKHHERIGFVQLFLEAMIDAPKKLWHPVLVVVDEAHVFCPEGGKAESSAAVIDLATRGRKRGYCAVLATQRISKLRKDAAAECNNVLIGRTGLDIDIKRAADVLGFAKDRHRELRQLEPGSFFGFGPALSLEVRAIAIGPVVTTHPKAGSRIAFTPPPPTAAVRALLPQLADLPAEAEHQARNLDEAKKEIAQLKRERTVLQKGAPVAPPKEKIVERRVEVPVLKEGQLARFEKLMGGFPDRLTFAVEPARLAALAVPDRITTAVEPVVTVCREIAQALARLNGHGRPAPIAPALSKPTPRPVTTSPRPDRPAVQPRVQASAAGDDRLSSAQQAILDAAAFLESVGVDYPDVVQLALFAGQSATGGYWRANIGRCRSLGLIEGTALTELGRTRAQPSTITTVDELHAHIMQNLLQGPQRKILQVLVEAYPTALSPEEVGRRAELEPNGGYWRANVGRLRSLKLITKKGPMAALPVLFLEGR